MAIDWEETTVGDLVKRGVLERPLDGNHGSTHPKGDDFVASGVPFIMASDLVGGSVDTVNCSFISFEQAKSLRKGFAKRGDVLISHKATLGRTALVGEIPGDFVMLTPQVTYYRPKDTTKLDSRYLKYYFDSQPFQVVLQSWAGAGSTRAYIGITDQLRLPVLFPPFAEQKAIAAVLGSLDDKIALNRKMNATLEAMARALFQSWFVDFDPVRTKPDGLPTAFLDSTDAALFPATFQDSALGPIPHGWDVCPLSEKIQLLSGGTPKTSEPAYWDGDIPWYSVRDAPSETDVWVTFTEKHVTKLGIANSAAQVFPEKTTIISARGTVGTLALTAVPMAMNQSCYGVRGRAGYGDYFTYYSVREATAQLQQRSHGTVFDTITTDTFRTLDCIFPPPQITVSFDNLVEPLLGQIRANLYESRTLATLRDTLLPKLLSGELNLSRVPTPPGTQ